MATKALVSSRQLGKMLKISKLEITLESRYETQNTDLSGLLTDEKWLNRTCGECESCKVGEYLGCPDVKLTGVSAGGTQSQYCTCQEAHAIRIPKHYPMESVVHVRQPHLKIYELRLTLDLDSLRGTNSLQSCQGLGLDIRSDCG